MGDAARSTDEWAFLAYGLIVCVATICFSYLVLRLWPQRHYPRFFALLAAITSVAGMYVLEVPGAGFGLAALMVLMYISLCGLEALFEEPTPAPGSQSRPQPVAPMATFLSVSLGLGIGLVVSFLAVAALVLPPRFLYQWISHPDPLAYRIERAMNPGEDWVALRTKEREATAALKKAQAELASTTKRMTDAELALERARDELGAAASNTVRGIQISERTGSRHANGAIYIGVKYSLTHSDIGCIIHVSTDKVDSSTKKLSPGDAMTITTDRGKYRIVLVGIDSKSCTFDLVKD